MSPVLTKRKKQILDFITTFKAGQGYFPTLEEIAQRFKLRSVATVHQHLAELETLGWLKRDHKQARSMHLASSPTLPMSVSSHEMIQLPIVGLITAGAPIEAIEHTTSYLPVAKELLPNDNAYILKVKGDSMIESLIANGDYVIVHKQDYANNGDIVVALLDDGTATLKEFHREKNYIRLQPRNHNYKPIKVRNVIIQGKVLGIIRQFQNQGI